MNWRLQASQTCFNLHTCYTRQKLQLSTLIKNELTSCKQSTTTLPRVSQIAQEINQYLQQIQYYLNNTTMKTCTISIVHTSHLVHVPLTGKNDGRNALSDSYSQPSTLQHRQVTSTTKLASQYQYSQYQYSRKSSFYQFKQNFQLLKTEKITKKKGSKSIVVYYKVKQGDKLEIKGVLSFNIRLGAFKYVHTCKCIRSQVLKDSNWQ
eukprot:TRINITY_DN5272_c0_g1_i5.p1 TRINITY_DN5272_c0_g1~~TRINITY_DN5272_c0_g1_i5.p1  ORF type:complete len:207 (+),score=-20.61 TRINITY_DN5272_c0_g1_i5:86-706(+)